MTDVDDLADRLFAAREAIFAHVGYVVQQHERRWQDWRLLAIEDRRHYFWAIDARECVWVRYSQSYEALAHWLVTGKDHRPHGAVLYESPLQSMRYLPKWIYRGTELTIAVANEPDNIGLYLQVFRSASELRMVDGKLIEEARP